MQAPFDAIGTADRAREGVYSWLVPHCTDACVVVEMAAIQSHDDEGRLKGFLTYGTAPVIIAILER